MFIICKITKYRFSTTYILTYCSELNDKIPTEYLNYKKSETDKKKVKPNTNYEINKKILCKVSCKQ